MKKIVVISALLVSLIFVLAPRASALVCGESIPADTPLGVLNDYKKDCEQKIANSRGIQSTLSATIGYLNNQISLTQAKVASTTLELDKLNVEIQDLSGRIESIDYSLDDLTKLFISRVRETYMKPGKFDTAIIAQSSGLPDILRNIEYTKKIRDHDRSILISLEKSRLDASAQKELKEAKQAEIEALKKKLDADKAALNSQIASKNQLLTETKNDEKRYQSLRQEAANRVAQLANYSSSRGGGSLLSGTTKCDDWGCYYNQRDSQWGSKVIGNSDMSMASVGCLVTSAAMVASHYGRSLTPGDIAASSNPFEYDTADMRFNWLGSVNGTTVSRSAHSCSGSGCLGIIDSEISSGRPVIVRITASNVAGTHFIVITKKEGDNYIMKDPFEADGNNISFTSKHSISSITRVDKVSVN
jgi:peptidoglycan hydrolase CwlO-like protein